MSANFFIFCILLIQVKSERVEERQGRFVFNFGAPGLPSPFACALGFQDPACFEISSGRCSPNDPWCIIAERSKKWPFSNPIEEPSCYMGSTDPRCPSFYTSTSTTSPNPLFTGNSIPCYPGSQHPRCQNTFKVFKVEATTDYIPLESSRSKFTGPAFCYPGAPDIRCKEKINIPELTMGKHPELSKNLLPPKPLQKELVCEGTQCVQTNSSTESNQTENCTCSDLLKNNSICTSTDCKIGNRTCLIRFSIKQCSPRVITTNITLPISKIICGNRTNTLCFNSTFLKITENVSSSDNQSTTIKPVGLNIKNKIALLNMVVNTNNTRNYTTNEKSQCSTSKNSTNCQLIVGNCQGLNSTECSKKETLKSPIAIDATSNAQVKNESRKIGRKEDATGNITLTTFVNITTPLSANGKLLTLYDKNNLGNATVMIDLLPKLSNASLSKISNE